MELFKAKFGFESVNFLDYYRVKREVLTLFKSNGICPTNVPFTLLVRPIIPFHLKILLKHNKGTKDFYRILNKNNNNNNSSLLKWNTILEHELEINFGKVFKVCFKTVKDNYLIWLQYKIIYQIIGTRKQLFKLRISNSPTCFFCNSEEETIQHLFYDCVYICRKIMGYHKNLD